MSDHCLRSLLYLLDRYSSDSKFEAIVKDVKRKVSEFANGTIPQSNLTRKLQRYSASERQSAIQTLLDSEELFKHVDNSKPGRPTVTYFTPRKYREVEKARDAAV